MTGPWFTEQATGWQPPPALERFRCRTPPVYIGFGSMGFGGGRHQRTRILLNALIGGGHRVIVATGWGGLGLPADEVPGALVHVTESIPHDWLFPRTSAVIHHGGAGTTIAGLRAGRPTLICPVVGDQSFWGHQVRRIGAGPAPIPQRRLTSQRLTPAVRGLADDPIRRRARTLGTLIRSEDGIAEAIRVVEDLR